MLIFNNRTNSFNSGLLVKHFSNSVRTNSIPLACRSGTIKCHRRVQRVITSRRRKPTFKTRSLSVYRRFHQLRRQRYNNQFIRRGGLQIVRRHTHCNRNLTLTSKWKYSEKTSPGHQTRNLRRKANAQIRQVIVTCTGLVSLLTRRRIQNRIRIITRLLPLRRQYSTRTIHLPSQKGNRLFTIRVGVTRSQLRGSHSSLSRDKLSYTIVTRSNSSLLTLSKRVRQFRHLSRTRLRASILRPRREEYTQVPRNIFLLVALLLMPIAN